jgi:hypothetical protein
MLLTGLFRAARRRLQTRDTDLGEFRVKIEDLIKSKDTYSDEEIAEKVEELKTMTNDLPDSDDKSQLVRFLEDFKEVKSQDEATAKEAGKAVADMFEKLDTEAMKDYPDTTETTEEVEEVVKETEDPESTTDSNEEVEEVEEKEEEKEIVEDDPNGEYTMEELYQFFKKRLYEDEEIIDFIKERMNTTEDGCNDDDGCQSLGEYAKENVKEDIKNVTQTNDHAPQIKVNLKQNANNEGIAGLFAQMKGGR